MPGASGFVMERGPGPRANRQKTQEWQRRSAQRAEENRRAKVNRKDRGELVPGQIGKRPPPAAPSPLKRVEFRGPMLSGRSCAQCLADGKSRKAAAWHHWLGQQHIRAYVDSQRIRDEGQDRALRRRLLHDERNLSPMCWRCHDDHENVANGRKFAAGLVPEPAREFAAELGPWFVVRLEHDYL